MSKLEILSGICPIEPQYQQGGIRSGLIIRTTCYLINANTPKVHSCKKQIYGKKHKVEPTTSNIIALKVLWLITGEVRRCWTCCTTDNPTTLYIHWPHHPDALHWWSDLRKNYDTLNLRILYENNADCLTPSKNLKDILTCTALTVKKGICIQKLMERYSQSEAA
jgi:hypothetical protein